MERTRDKGEEISKKFDSVSFDVAKFVVLYALSTGKIPDRRRIKFLNDFVHLSLAQASGGFDALADEKAKDGANHSGIVKVYWTRTMVDKYKNLLEQTVSIYNNEDAHQVRVAMAKSYQTFHRQESISRGIAPNCQKLPEAVEKQDMILDYRNSINEDYTRVMLEILNPSSDQITKQENDKLIDNVILPTMKAYQVLTDAAQYGLESQKTKLTIDKTFEINLQNLNTFQRMTSLTKEAFPQANEHLRKIAFPNRITPFSLRTKFTKAVAGICYAKELVEYQIFNSQVGRYPQVV